MAIRVGGIRFRCVPCGHTWDANVEQDKCPECHEERVEWLVKPIGPYNKFVQRAMENKGWGI